MWIKRNDRARTTSKPPNILEEIPEPHRRYHDGCVSYGIEIQVVFKHDVLFDKTVTKMIIGQ